MIQISTPTQILPAEGFSQDSSVADDSPFFEQKAQKTHHTGIFAELLKAFTGKELPPEEDEAGEHGFAWQVSAYLNQPAVNQSAEESEEVTSLLPTDVFNDEAVSEGLSGFSRQELLAVQYPDVPGQAALSDYSWQVKPDKESVPELLTRNAEESPAFEFLQNHSGENHFDAGNAAVKATGLTVPETEASQALLRPDFAKAASGEGDKTLLAELREKKARDKPVIEVRDLRSAEGRNAANSAGVNQGLVQQASHQFSHHAYNGAGLEGLQPTHPELGINVDLNPSPQLGDGWTVRKTGREFSQGRLFEDALARELRGNLSMDIVKNATLIVRNGGEGTIRLALNPASLGHVKIHLEMTENKIMGHIIVDSSEALRAFQRELPVLERAFRDSGFIDASLDMSLAQDGGEFGEERHQWTEGNFPALAAARYDAGMESEPVEEMAFSDKALLTASTGRKTVNLFI